MTTDHGNILVVDDTPDNLRLLSVMLSEQGYKVRKALNGQTALKTIHQVPPDLILLDINMPSMNGYDVCQKLKKDPVIQDIPVIFISALDDVLDKVKAFEVGGVDYITKPFQSEEVIARIENQLIIQRQKKQLQQEIKERQKTEQTLRVYLHAVSHDLRNPMLGLSMVLKNLLKKNQDKKEEKIEISWQVLEQMSLSCDRQLNLINSLVETQQFEMGGISLDFRPLNLFTFSQQLATEWEPMLKEKQAILLTQIPADLPLISGDSDRLWRVFENLLANALKHNDNGIKLTLKAEVIETNKSNFIRCILEDNGVGITPEQAATLFESYQRGEEAKRTLGLGLGLYLCRQIIEAHGGEIGVITEENNGAKFWLTLPILGE
ncbi:hybrid sensor histidine kinase/response regulator [Crocosphaera sp. XPORK-15E]|uniref:hybrid sensor histidine kinase/response regulator n=1 Tax=Crocosphaera sp. XPORK-15E TaxID=3110247 RepID=UPI002B202363|nr:hybrid sensor histidine kinase/response regulator [Crocosphaera sp. XPORK-15E]MEA5535532.1 hybrid sensor histidine kinase/response regulator [Crocosphaera sp. XPORK-15E]